MIPDWMYKQADKLAMEIRKEKTNAKLSAALSHSIWQNHKIGNVYTMDNISGWKIAYYPIFEDAKTGEVYEEPRALVEKPITIKGIEGTDFREVPLRYLK